MLRVTLRFYAELNDLLPSAARGREVVRELPETTSIKDLIESTGVPHTEIDVVLVHGASVDFSYRVQDGDRIAVYPVFETLDVTPLVRLRPAPLRATRFVLDVQLGRLARYLRLFGFDVSYSPQADGDTLVTSSLQEARILLSRDRELLKRRELTHAAWVRSTRPREQLVEVLRRLDLGRQVQPFVRCTECNDLLATVDKAEILERLPPRSREHATACKVCPGCDKLYWDGSHVPRIRALVEQVLATLAANSGKE